MTDTQNLTPLQRAFLAIEKLQARLAAAERARREPIAVVGLACRLPGGADDPDALWELLARGGDAVGPVPAARWDGDRLYDPDPDAAGKMYVREGGFLAGAVDEFDAAFFRIAPLEAEVMDPQQRLLLELAWEALEDAGIPPEGLCDAPLGVYVGISGSDFVQMQARAGASPGAYAGTGGAVSVAAGRIAYVLGARGPALAVDTACSSSLVAVHLAVQDLRGGRCRVALAGGVNLMLQPDATVGACKLRAIARDGRCKSFDERADGYIRGEGGGLVALKRLCDALADGDRVLAVIAGSAVGHDGRSSGLTVPSGPAQEALLRTALADAGAAPADVRMVECHGTGTPLGDPIEVQALAAALGEGRRADDPLLLGAVKTNLGHLEAAAGIAGLIKMVLAIRRGRIPGNLHFAAPNHRVPWAALPVKVVAAAQDWPPGPRLAGVSAFGLSGTNAHVLVGQAPPAAAPEPAGRAEFLLVVSARTEPALTAALRRMAARVEGAAPAELRDICFTAGARRSHHARRAAVVGGSGRALAAALRRLADGEACVEGARGAIDARAEAADMSHETDDSDLAALARLYVRGGWSGFSRLYPRGRVVGLPTYPWQRERHWPGPPGPTAAVGPGPHPWLGPEVDLCAAPELRGWPALVSRARMPALADHAVRGQALVPAALLVELLRAAGRVALGAEPVLEDIHYASAWLLRDGADDPAQVVAATIAGGVRLQVASREHGGPWRTHATAVARVGAADPTAVARVGAADPTAVARIGAADPTAARVGAVDPTAARVGAVDPTAARVGAADPTAARVGAVDPTAVARVGELDPASADPLELPAIAARCGESLAGEAFYAELAARGLEYGPRFRGLTRIQRRDGEALAWVRPGPRGGAAVDPAVLDACLQAFGAAAPRSADARPFVPAAIGRVRLAPAAAAAEIRWCHAEVASHGPDEVRGGLRLADADGRIVGVLEDLVARAVQPPAAGLSGALLELRWRPASPPAAAPAGAWLVLADEAGPGAALCARLRAAGAAVERVSFGPGACEHVATALSRETARGVVLAWPADPGPAAPDPAASDRGVAAGLELAQRLAGLRDPPRLWCVTTRAQAVRAGEAVDPGHAPLWGLRRVLAHELPALRSAAVDLGGDPHELDTLVALLAAPGPEDEWALRGPDAFVARLERRADATRRWRPRADRGHVISGGLGGLGLATAAWLVARGARHLALLGRGEPDDAALRDISALREAGARVDVVRVDVADPDAWAAAAAALERSLPPLGGVFHAAGVLDDGVVTRQTRDRLAAVLRPKVDGAWHLHRWAARAEVFVLFASAAAILGPLGQSTYAAANAYLGALAHHRRGRGQHALCVDWGPWSTVGRAAEAVARGEFAARGFAAIDPADGFLALEGLLAADVTAAAVLPLDLRRWRESPQDVPGDPRFADLLAAAPTLAPTAAAAALRERLGGLAPADRAAGLLALVREQVGSVLRLAAARIDADEPLASLGLDSLTSLALRQRLEAATGLELSATVLWNYPTPTALAATLGERLGLGPGATDVTPPDDPDARLLGELLGAAAALDVADLTALLRAGDDGAPPEVVR